VQLGLTGIRSDARRSRICGEATPYSQESVAGGAEHEERPHAEYDGALEQLHARSGPRDQIRLTRDEKTHSGEADGNDQA